MGAAVCQTRTAVHMEFRFIVFMKGFITPLYVLACMYHTSAHQSAVVLLDDILHHCWASATVSSRSIPALLTGLYQGLLLARCPIAGQNGYASSGVLLVTHG